MTPTRPLLLVQHCSLPPFATTFASSLTSFARQLSLRIPFVTTSQLPEGGLKGRHLLSS